MSQPPPLPSAASSIPEPPKARGSFSVVRMVTICAAIGVGLMALIAAVGYWESSIAIGKAKNHASQAIASDLELAINNFYTDTDELPKVGTQVQTDSAEGIKLLEILLGLEDRKGKVQNFDSVKYLSVKETKTKSKGLLYNETGRSVIGLYDTWGNPFTVVLNPKPALEPLRFTVGGKEEILKGRKVAIYSPGADKKPGTADDVRTW